MKQDLNQKLKKAAELYLYFFRTGWFTFGGGWSIVAQIQKDYVENRQEIDSEELLNIVSVSRSVPGTMIGNVAYLFGYHLAGVPGALASVTGIVTPPVIILSVLTFCYTQVKENLYVARALVGVRAVVAPIILSAALKLHKGAYPKWYYVLLTLGACYCSGWLKMSNVLLVVGGVAAGLLLNLGKKEGTGHGAA